MTAQVAVLNPNGIALASDSAVTIVGGSTVRSYNSADKIFPVPGVPLAVLHSGSVGLFGVPWEVLVKQWAQSRRDRVAPAVEDYASEFTSWLSQQRNLVSTAAESGFFRWMVQDFLLMLRTRLQRELDGGGLDKTVTRTPTNDVAALIEDTMEKGVEILEGLDDFDGLNAQKAARWCDALEDELNQDISWVFDDVPFNDRGVELAHQVARLLVHKTEPFSSDAVLTFAGYGEDDFFPSLYRVTLSGSVAGVVRRYEESRVAVSSMTRVTITPLGLTEAIHSFLRGLSPQYRDTAHESLEAFKAAAVDAGADVEVLDKQLRDAHRDLEQSFDKVEWEEFLSPMLEVVETLPMTEMVRLADALVGLAALRQVVRGETSVGGPVDLARLTRSAGFEWIRTKNAEIA